MKKFLLFFVYLFKGLIKSSIGRFLVLASIILIIFIIIEPPSLKKDKTIAKYHTSIEAYINAQNFVKKQLKAPSTAKFPKSTELRNHVIKIGQDKFQINSWVDAQNSFGAMLRKEFSCIIEFKQDSVFCSKMVIN